MRIKESVGSLFKMAAGLSVAGTLLGMSCSSEGVQAVVAGIDAVAQSLSQHDQDDDISFGDWLLSELDD